MFTIPVTSPGYLSYVLIYTAYTVKHQQISIYNVTNTDMFTVVVVNYTELVTRGKILWM